MPKTVFFVRHAKSSWNDIGLKDHDRPLNKRGFRDAPIMATQVLEKLGNVDQIITSTAKRAASTALFFQKVHKIDPKLFFSESDLYHGDLEDYIEGVRVWAKDELDCAALFAHNPGMTYLANNFSEEYIDNVPTCGVLKVVFDVGSFKEINTHNGRLEAFYFPKMFL